MISFLPHTTSTGEPKLITITRRQALPSIRHAPRFGQSRGNSPGATFIGDKEGLIVRCMSADVAIECRIPGERPAETINMPFEFLTDVEGKRTIPSTWKRWQRSSKRKLASRQRAKAHQIHRQATH